MPRNIKGQWQTWKHECICILTWLHIYMALLIRFCAAQCFSHDLLSMEQHRAIRTQPHNVWEQDTHKRTWTSKQDREHRQQLKKLCCHSDSRHPKWENTVHMSLGYKGGPSAECRRGEVPTAETSHIYIYIKQRIYTYTCIHLMRIHMNKHIYIYT